MSDELKELSAEAQRFIENLPEESDLPSNKLEGPGHCMKYSEFQDLLKRRGLK